MRSHFVLSFVLGAAVGGLGGWLVGRDAGGAAAAQEAAGSDLEGGVDRADSLGGRGLDAEKAPQLAGAGADEWVRLRGDLAAARQRIASLEGAARAAAAFAGAPAVGGAAGRAPGAPKPVPPALLATAKRLGVSTDALAAAWRLRTGDYEDRKTALLALQAFGDEALRAMAAMAIAPGHGHTMIPGVIAELKVPGAESLLLELLRTNDHNPLLMRALGKYDTPAIRDYVVSRVPHAAGDAGDFMRVAQTLGELREPRGAEAITIEVLQQEGWGGVRGHVLYAIGQMGGPHAARLLIDYISKPSADHMGTAVRALAAIDPSAAQAQARRLLASDRAAFFRQFERRTLQDVAAEDE